MLRISIVKDCTIPDLFRASNLLTNESGEVFLCLGEFHNYENSWRGINLSTGEYIYAVPCNENIYFQFRGKVTLTEDGVAPLPQVMRAEPESEYVQLCNPDGTMQVVSAEYAAAMAH